MTDLLFETVFTV